MRDDDLEERRAAELGYREASAREVRLREWMAAPPDEDFQRLIWRLQARKYWQAKNPESKARILEYRRQWAKDHPEQVRASMLASKRRFNARNRERLVAEKRAKYAAKSQARREATVYVCQLCGAEWCQIGRIPSRPPKFCSQPCKSRIGYLRAKAAGKR